MLNHRLKRWFLVFTEAYSFIKRLGHIQNEELMNNKTAKEIALQTGIDPFLIIDDEFKPIQGNFGPDDYKDDGPSIKETIEGL